MQKVFKTIYKWHLNDMEYIYIYYEINILELFRHKQMDAILVK